MRSGPVGSSDNNTVLEFSSARADEKGMIKTVIVETDLGFSTYSGWIVDRNDDFLLMSVLSDPSHDPMPVAIPVARIVSDVDIAA